jgi:hypothetical protein
MSVAYCCAGLCVRGSSVRSIVSLKVCAVTGSFDGGENRNPFRIVKVYVFPSAETAGSASATSGSRCDPAGAGASG